MKKAENKPKNQSNPHSAMATGSAKGRFKLRSVAGQAGGESGSLKPFKHESRSIFVFR